MPSDKKDIKQIVKTFYSNVATGKHCCSSCGCGAKDEQRRVAKDIGYSEEDIARGGDANLGLGCGNPTALGEIQKGDVVLDLGSGAGFDCFLAAKKVGESGKVIGVDMTEEMIKKARAHALTYGYTNIEFRLGDIENLPIEDDSVDVVMSNCVVNLAPDKLKVFKEAYRVLRIGGRMYLSDIVLLKEISKEHRENETLIAGCVGGALLREAYVDLIQKAGFKVNILSEDTEISKRQYEGIPLESLKVEAIKL